ncbi:MAG: protoglobin domain-containing protein [Myxococcota bacterium]
MAQPDYMARLKIGEAELRSRRSFFDIHDEDLQRLAGLKDFAERHTDAIIEEFYDHLLSHPETREILTADPDLVPRLKRKQKAYFLGLFDGRLDLDYVQDRLRVGIAHERHGMAPKFYVGAYTKYLKLIQERLFEDFEREEAIQGFASITKLVMFDMSLAIDTYIAAHLETLGRHQRAIRELSTPVIRVHDRVLLLPLVGTIDSHRAMQIMETTLSKVAEEQAKVLILDIAGVPVVDTQVADHLLKATAAVRLLGGQVILTGISPQVARTIVELGVEIETMDTRNRLSDGLELALQSVGRKIVPTDGEGV